MYYTQNIENSQHNFTPTWLYIKQHNITGLKYFGKTTSADPVKYKGSGRYWLRHLKSHGNLVTTVWAKLFTSFNELTEYAKNFSDENNIVESIEWANLIPESGLDGGGIKGKKHGPMSAAHKQKLREARQQRPTTERQLEALRRSRESRIYKPMSEESKAKLSKSKKLMSDETKKLISEARTKFLFNNQSLYKVISPAGECFEKYSIDLKQLCSENNLIYKNLIAAARRSIKHRGWQAFKI